MQRDASSSARRVSIRPGVSILSVLRYLNYKPWFALAEFVDNAVQSFADNTDRLRSLHGDQWKLKVFIHVDTSTPGRIVVRDNAAGIPKDAFPRAFRPAVAPPNRTGLSEFGMGMKSAACWFAPRWKVRTKALGENVERSVEFDIAHIVRDDLEELNIQERAASANDHYTEVILEDLHHIPVGRSLGKIKEHLTDIYRVLLRSGLFTLQFGTELLLYEDPPILLAPFYKHPQGPSIPWREEINFDLGEGLSVNGFAALRDPGNYSRSGFALFRRFRLIEGSGEEGYRPGLLFGTSGSSSYARLRLFGELHLQGFDVSHTKDGFRWDENEEPFLELLKEHLDSEDLPLLKQCEHYRALASKKDRARAATRALGRVGDAIIESMPAALPEIADAPPFDTSTEPLDQRPVLATRELRFDFRGSPWKVVIDLSDDPSEGDWLSIADLGIDQGGADTIEIRVSMAHPFMISFAQTSADEIEPILRIAAGIAISEKLARRSGVKSAGTVRRNLNELLREALSNP